MNTAPRQNPKSRLSPRLIARSAIYSAETPRKRIQSSGVIGHVNGPFDVMAAGDLTASVAGLTGRGLQSHLPLRLPSYIRRVDTPTGVRYEVRINPTRGSSDRRQLKRRFATVAEATAWHTRTAAELADGTHITASDLTVKVACEAWLKAKALRTKPTTIEAYTFALAPVIERYGGRRVQSITKADVEQLVTELVADAANAIAAL